MKLKNGVKTMGEAMEIKALNHSFGPNKILDNITLQVESQKIVALLGPSGCGKTTLLKLCAGLIELVDGEISSPFTQQAFMFQQANLLPWKNTLDNIALGLKAAGMKKSERQGLASQFGYSLGLSPDDMQKFPHELSGGMQQRVALARAMVLKPDLLLLDEPFSALDMGLKLELYQLLLHHTRELGSTVLMITHDVMEAVRLCDTIYLMQTDPGRIVDEFALNVPIRQRTDTWVYKTAAELMANINVQNSFCGSNAGASCGYAGL